MRQLTGTRKSPGEKIVKDIKRATRKHYSSEEKIRIVRPNRPSAPRSRPSMPREPTVSVLPTRWKLRCASTQQRLPSSM